MIENLIRDEPVSEVVRENFAGYRRYLAAAREDARCAAGARGGARARASAPRSATRSPSRRGARSRSTRASTTRRPSSSWRGSRLLADGASAPARLVTIPISHYCEKARWALDRAAIAYREERHVQVIHRVASRRAGGGGTVPVLVAPEGVFAQSADILAYADRHTSPPRGCTPRSPRGAPRSSPSSATSTPTSAPRAGAGCTSTSCPERDLGRAYNCTGVPAWERRAFPLMLGVMSGYIRHLFAIGPETGTQAGAAVQRTFDAVAARLDDGRRYLCGDAFTAADLAFAALAAPASSRREYGVPLPQPDELPPDMAAGVRAFRAHPGGGLRLPALPRGALRGRRRPSARDDGRRWRPSTGSS